MAKATPPKTPTVEQMAEAAQDAFAAPMANATEYLEQVRAMAEDGMSKTKDAVEKARAAYEDLQKEAETSINTAQEHSAKISLAAIDTMRASSESTFKHLEKMVSIKSVAELVELQTAFVREQAEKAVDTAKTMQDLYQKAGEEMAAPAKAAAEKAMSALKND